MVQDEEEDEEKKLKKKKKQKREISEDSDKRTCGKERRGEEREGRKEENRNSLIAIMNNSFGHRRTGAKWGRVAGAPHEHREATRRTRRMYGCLRKKKTKSAEAESGKEKANR